MNTETPHLDHNKTNSFLLICYCPLDLRCNNEVVWTNPVPNSTGFARPISLARAKEERDVIQVEIGDLKQHINNQDMVDITMTSGEHSQVKFSTQCSMIDGKIVGLLMGDTGAYCHMCICTREDANNIINIEEGFHINKSMNLVLKHGKNCKWRNQLFIQGTARSVSRKYSRS